MKRLLCSILMLLTIALAPACKKQPAATPAAPAPAPFPGAVRPAPSGSTILTDTPPAPPVIPTEQPVSALPDPMSSASLEAINKDSPLKPIFFAYDSDALDEKAQQTMAANADLLKKYASWVVTVEGHCDERGTAEYNLALGDRRAQAVKNYLISLGVQAERLRTVSYGSEFPFTLGHDEGAWALNRRAHFMLTAKTTER